MKHELETVYMTCPNCNKNLFPVKNENFVFVCSNPTCEWIAGPDYEIYLYLTKKVKQEEKTNPAD